MKRHSILLNMHFGRFPCNFAFFFKFLENFGPLGWVSYAFVFTFLKMRSVRSLDICSKTKRNRIKPMTCLLLRGRFYIIQMRESPWIQKRALHEKCSNTGFFLVPIFSYLDQKKLRIWTLFTWWLFSEYRKKNVCLDFYAKKIPVMRMFSLYTFKISLDLNNSLVCSNFPLLNMMRNACFC